jgi:hypothetical protein
LINKLFYKQKTNIQILRIFQTNFEGNQKLIKTQNNLRKLLKLIQIQLKTFKKKPLLKPKIVNMICYNYDPLRDRQMLRVYSISLYYKISLLLFNYFLTATCEFYSKSKQI